MNKMSAAARRFYENATLIAALRLLFKSLDAMGTPLKKMAEVAETSSGGTPSRSVSEYFGGEIPWIKSGDLTDGTIIEVEEHITRAGLENSSAQIFPAGTVVVALYGATVGKTGILTFAAASNQAVCAVMPKDNRITNEFLYWFLKHKRQDFLDASFGGAQPNISQKTLRETMIPVPSLELQKRLCQFFEAVERRQRGDRNRELPELPPPLSEQRRIVAKIEQLAAKIEEARGLRQNSEPEIDFFWRSNLRTVFDQLSRSAQTITFQEVCDVVRGGSPRPAGNPLYYDGHIPFLKVGDITKDSAMYLTSHTATIKTAGLSKTRMIPTDTLMLTNSGATLGVPKICTFETTFNDGIQALINLRSDISKPYLYYFLFSKTQWFRDTAARGQGQPNLNTAMVKVMSFPCPPLAEQSRIVAYLDGVQAQVDHLKALQAQTAAELEALLPSILDKAFKGEL